VTRDARPIAFWSVMNLSLITGAIFVFVPLLAQ
jgi:hypothetical protein